MRLRRVALPWADMLRPFGAEVSETGVNCNHFIKLVSVIPRLRDYSRAAFLAESGLFVVSPHTDDFDYVLGVMDLIHQAMLDVDAAGIGSGQISNELFVWRRILKWVLRDDVEKTLRLRFEI